MSEELKPCPFCGGEAFQEEDLCYCADLYCPLHTIYFDLSEWNTRPIEDTLRSQLALAEKRLEVAREAMQNMEDVLRDGDGREEIHAPGDSLVEALCEREGYGFVMDSAARLWSRKDPNGAFICGPCKAVINDARKQMRVALAELDRSEDGGE